MGANGNGEVWTPQMLAYLASAFNDGATMAQLIEAISVRFGVKVTRNAITGRVFRLRKEPGVITRPAVSPLPATEKRTRCAERKRKSRAKLRATPAPILVSAPLPPEPAPLIGTVRLEDMPRTGACRYPYGDGPFSFCGCPVVPGKVYCAAHAERCYVVKPVSMAVVQGFRFGGGNRPSSSGLVFHGRGRVE